jgi:hypothetical protein
METTMRTVPTSAPDTHHAAQALALPLPFDDGSDDAVPFVLTAAAHREVLGRDAPPLVAVPREAPTRSPGGTAQCTTTVADDAGDTRRAQARALLHSGMRLRGWDSNPQTFRLTADCSAS